MGILSFIVLSGKHLELLLYPLMFEGECWNYSVYDLVLCRPTYILGEVNVRPRPHVALRRHANSFLCLNGDSPV